ncbi:thiolase family protein [Paraconexibacter antarcticus]|uniref:Thiolase family protein n=1 Tax=Paraconexibacter antarcticus TaxID=2949664 RepID=A0ABY5DR69_9ACTN|nr:thiolase family protein [Paraconexibacter antarcticus]UTI63748.1 thiolase family protein [Paraconexibacter antarcticus]
MATRDAVIVEAVRTPVGRRDGGLAGTHPVDLSAHLLRALAERTGIDPAQVEDVVWGVGAQVGDQSFNVARSAVLAAGWPEAIPGVSIDRQCGSSQQAVHFAAAGLVAGHHDVVVAGGIESMSRVPMGASAAGGEPYGPGLLARYGGVAPNQGVGAELIAERWGLSRTELDEFALSSHERAAAAIDGGRFTAQIAPVPTAGGVVVDTDEGVRRGGTVESLARLRPAFREDGTVTAGNASQISDGGGALLMTTSAKAAELGLEPIARVHSVAVAAEDPVIMLTAPIPATAKVLRRAGLALADINCFEVNQAFASVALAWLADTGADREKLNPNGGAIALGHPIGGSGARIMTTLVHHLRDTGGRYGLQTMCEGGGMANATIIEAL